MNITGMNFPNILKALIWTHMASNKPHIWYVKMILVQSQVSRWHFQTSIMNNTGMNFPTISSKPASGSTIWCLLCQDIKKALIFDKESKPNQLSYPKSWSRFEKLHSDLKCKSSKNWLGKFFVAKNEVKGKKSEFRNMKNGQKYNSNA